MNLYLISQDVLNDYWTFDSAVVCAESREKAKMIHPSADEGMWGTKCWPDSRHVEVKYLGAAVDGLDAGVICSSYNPG